MGNKQLRVFFRQEDAAATDMAGAIVVLIDVLRATSTLAAALAAGARGAWCFEAVSDVFRAQESFADGPVLLCGERDGQHIKGFDLGNSPSDFTSARCAGRTLLMSTTNGTRALRLTTDAREVVLGSFFNLMAIVNHVSRSGGPATFLCAGTEGERSEEDVACAGAIAEKLPAGKWELTPSAIEAMRTWRRARRTLKKFLLASRGGVPLVRIGLAKDVIDCSRRNRFGVIPLVVKWKDGACLVMVSH